MKFDATNWRTGWLAPPTVSFAVRVCVCLLVFAGFVLACSPDAPLDGVVDAGEEATPPGWPLEIGDTITTVALRDLMRRFRPMGWADATYLARNPEHHKERIRRTKYGIAVFEFAFVEVPRDYKHSTTYACPPPGFVLYPDAEVLTTDGAIVSNDLPTDSPCDPDKRFAGGSIYYVGQVR